MYVKLFYNFQHCSFCVLLLCFSFFCFLFYTKRNDLARPTVNYADVGAMMQAVNLIDDVCASVRCLQIIQMEYDDI